MFVILLRVLLVVKMSLGPTFNFTSAYNRCLFSHVLPRSGHIVGYQMDAVKSLCQATRRCLHHRCLGSRRAAVATLRWLAAPQDREICVHFDPSAYFHVERPREEDVNIVCAKLQTLCNHSAWPMGIGEVWWQHQEWWKLTKAIYDLAWFGDIFALI